MSPASKASARRPTISRSRLEPGRRRSFASDRGQAGFERGARAAQQAVGRGLAGVEHLGDLGGAKTEHVAQHEYGTLLGREMLKARDERQRDRLLGFVARVGPRGVVGDAVKRNIREGFEPDRLRPAGRFRHLSHPLAFRSAPARSQGIHRAVGGDPVQPRTDRRASLELLKAAPGGEQRLLKQVLSVLS
jgi:hypothetical protein